MKDKQNKFEERVISLVLQAGVLTSVIIILVGLVVFFTRHAGADSFTGTVSYQAFTSTAYKYPHSISELVTAIKAGEGAGVMTLGILLLILVPMLRVLATVVLFIRERDIPMTVVTILTMVVLIGSFYLGIIFK